MLIVDTLKLLTRHKIVLINVTLNCEPWYLVVIPGSRSRSGLAGCPCGNGFQYRTVPGEGFLVFGPSFTVSNIPESARMQHFSYVFRTFLSDGCDASGSYCEKALPFN